MRWRWHWIVATLFCCASLGVTAPTLPVPRTSLKIEPFGRRDLDKTFAGGELSTVVATGSGISYLGLYVYDDFGNCVAMDDFGNEHVSDDNTAVWYVPKTAHYRVEIMNQGRRTENGVLVLMH